MLLVAVRLLFDFNTRVSTHIGACVSLAKTISLLLTTAVSGGWALIIIAKKQGMIVMILFNSIDGSLFFSLQKWTEINEILCSES
jgi:hypothetical protein